jgi:hypothetical protein
MKPLSHLFRITLLAALLAAATTLNTSPVTQAHAEGAVIIVNAETDNGTSGDQRCSLREAIMNANEDVDPPNHPDCAPGSGNDTISFADGVNTIKLDAPLPPATDLDGLTIFGGGDVIIHGQYQHRLFAVQSAYLTLASLNLFGGYAPTGTVGGGAVYNGYGVLKVTNSVFYFNLADNGGAILNDNGTLDVANSLFLENFSDHPTGAGGAVATRGIATFTNNTFSGNRAASGGDLSVSLGSATLLNNILADSQGGNCNYEAGTTVSGRNNLIEDAASACVFVNDVDGNIIGRDPIFATNKGVLSSTSPAIDKGDDAACTALPVGNNSYNGLPRPQGIRCDIGAYEYPQTLVHDARFLSSAIEDGQILESSEFSGVGGTLNNSASTFNLGDNAANKQYRAILSFDTSTLPPNAVITSATLWFKYAGKSGTNPFNTHGKLLVDVKTVNFGSTAALQLADFKATASKSAALSFTKTNLDPSGWYSQAFLPADFVYINRAGLTQFRLRFAKDDNNDFGADYLKIVSGDGDPYLVPQLLIDYYDR